jgi:uncharacterized membrane protein
LISGGIRQVDPRNAKAEKIAEEFAGPRAMAANHTERHFLHESEVRLLAELRLLRRKLRRKPAGDSGEGRLTLGQRVADIVATTMGSWRFIIIQSAVLTVWIALNITAYINHWDPYPFILLNLALSFQAAYAAPFIMMSQNRQQDVDRRRAENDYNINVKAELEIEALHAKIDELREKEVLALTHAIADLSRLLEEKQAAGGN